MYNNNSNYTDLTFQQFLESVNPRRTGNINYFNNIHLHTYTPSSFLYTPRTSLPTSGRSGARMYTRSANILGPGRTSRRSLRRPNSLSQFFSRNGASIVDNGSLQNGRNISRDSRLSSSLSSGLASSLSTTGSSTLSDSSYSALYSTGLSATPFTTTTLSSSLFAPSTDDVTASITSTVADFIQRTINPTTSEDAGATPGPRNISYVFEWNRPAVLSTSTMVDNRPPSVHNLNQNSELVILSHENESDFSSETHCAICARAYQYNNTEIVRRLHTCNHFFHQGCIDTWFSSHPTCPICRQAVSSSRDTLNTSETSTTSTLSSAESTADISNAPILEQVSEED